MRGDMRSNRDHHGDTRLQRDSSSGSSSPHSSSSHEDEILEVRPPGFIQKPIYNFSIPEVIKHEPRVERHEASDVLGDNIAVTSRRKRAHPTRNLRDHVTYSYEHDETPVNVRNKKRRKAAAAAEAMPDDDDDCHRPPVIDLTDMDSHDEYHNAHSDSEINDESHVETRPLHHANSSPSFNDVWSNIERFHQLTESQRRTHFMRSSSMQRLQRLRRRRISRPIVTDGPVVTDDMLVRTPEPVNVSTPELTSADDSVMVISEVRGHRNLDENDHAIALRMANDPTYSPPYNSASNASTLHHRHLSRYTRSDESFHQFQERIRAIRQRSRERLEQARRISQEAQERLARIHDSINHLRHGRTPADNTPNSVASNRLDEENSESRNRTENESNNDDVEIIREWNPRSLEYLGPPISVLSPLTASFHTSFNPRHRQHLPVPDFLRPLMNTVLSPVAPPRLHHLHHFQEDYEALLNLAERIGPAKPRGLNKQEIDLIPSFRYSTITAKETNTKCVICMGEYTNREKLRRLPCTHDFHSKCIDKWLRSNKTCPICRDEVNPTE